MDVGIFKRILLFAVMCIVQALVLNHVHLFNCATPLFYVYFVLLFPRNYPKWGILLWSFALGLVIDSFSNTQGVAAASMTFVGLLQPYMLALFVQRDSADDLKPTMKTLGMTSYVYYSFFLIFIYCLFFFTLETFSFFNWLQWLMSVGGSTVVTLLLVLVIESVRRKG